MGLPALAAGPKKIRPAAPQPAIHRFVLAAKECLLRVIGGSEDRLDGPPRVRPVCPSKRTRSGPDGWSRPWANRTRENGSFGVPKALPHSSLNPGRAAGGKGRGWLCSNPETRITRGAVCDILELANAHAQCSWSLSTESERLELLTGMKINGAKEESRSQAPSLEQRS